MTVTAAEVISNCVSYTNELIEKSNAIQNSKDDDYLMNFLCTQSLFTPPESQLKLLIFKYVVYLSLVF